MKSGPLFFFSVDGYFARRRYGQPLSRCGVVSLFNSLWGYRFPMHVPRFRFQNSAFRFQISGFKVSGLRRQISGSGTIAGAAGGTCGSGRDCGPSKKSTGLHGRGLWVGWPFLGVAASHPASDLGHRNRRPPPPALGPQPLAPRGGPISGPENAGKRGRKKHPTLGCVCETAKSTRGAHFSQLGRARNLQNPNDEVFFLDLKLGQFWFRIPQIWPGPRCPHHGAGAAERAATWWSGVCACATNACSGIQVGAS